MDHQYLAQDILVLSLNSPEPGRAKRESRISPGQLACACSERTYQKLLGPNHAARVNVSCNASVSARALKKNHFLWRWYCGKNIKIEIRFIVVCTLIDNSTRHYSFSKTFFSYCFCMLRLERVFRCYIVCETKEDYKEGCLMVWANYMSPCNAIVGLYFKVLVTSYQLPWQRTRSTKAASKFQFL